MKRKIPLSVTAFAWIFIAGAVLSLLSLAVSRGDSLQWRQVVARPFWIAQIGLSFILAMGGLIGGIKALKLIPYSRILLLWVAAVNLLEIIIFMPLVYFKAPFLAAGKAGSGGFSVGQHLISYIVAVTPAIIFFSASIYIFNLPDVKKQFIRK